MIAISERYQLDMENIASGSSAWHGIPLKDVGSESSFVIHAPVANLSTSRHPKSLLFLRRHQRYIIGYLAVYGDDEAPGSLEDFLLLAVTLVLCKGHLARRKGRHLFTREQTPRVSQNPTS
ncbi:uncharacterized protein isoform X2 [Musca autumnalis]|uniref:uncharacterized protein isoform X2 n=1 Tax=Musca autumnalis TaxID=221902 RepID=UPI003CEB4E9B